MFVEGKASQQEGELNELVTFWQEELGLKDWIIECRLSSTRDPDLEKGRGEGVRCSPSKSRAFINILRVEDRSSHEFNNDSIEVSVIIALLRLHFSICIASRQGGAVGVLFERALDSIARALWQQHQYASKEAEELEKTRSFFVYGPDDLKGEEECSDRAS